MVTEPPTLGAKEQTGLPVTDELNEHSGDRRMEVDFPPGVPRFQEIVDLAVPCLLPEMDG